MTCMHMGEAEQNRRSEVAQLFPFLDAKIISKVTNHQHLTSDPKLFQSETMMKKM